MPLTPSPHSPHVLFGPPMIGDPVASAPITKREPAAIAGAIAALVQAALVVAVAFGLKLTGDQITALAALAAVVVPLVQAVVTRSKVYAPATVEAAAAEPAGDYQPRRAAV